MSWGEESRHARGYGSSWDKVRKVVIERDLGMCQECKRQGIIKAGTDVDHIVSKAKAAQMGWTQEQMDDPKNLELLCHTPCHEAKTARETGRTYRPKVQIGLDGWPVENS